MSLGIRKIQTKLLLAFFLLICSAVVIGAVAFLYQRHTNKYHAYKSQLDELKRLTLQASLLQKDYLGNDAKDETYMASGESKILTQFKANNADMKNLLYEILQNNLTKELGLEANIERTETFRKNYTQTFSILQDKIRQRGFKNYGLEGKMRDYAHKLEAIEINKANLLMLRRHEKDFIIRKDMEYAAKLHKGVQAFLSSLPEKTTEAKKLEVQRILDDYEKHFDRIVTAEKEIGLSEQKGLRGQMAVAYRSIDTEIEEMSHLVSYYINDLIFQAQLIVISTILLMVVTASIFAIYFSITISRPIVLLDRISKSVIKGLRNQEEFLDKINANDEVGDLANNFKVMLTKLKNSISEAENKNTQLEEFAKEEAKRNWASEGLAIFGDILKNTNENLEKQAFEIIATLVKYTKSNQGGIFIVNDTLETEQNPHRFLELKACYAYQRQKFLSKHIEYGQGLIGSVWRDEDTRMITEIPDDYLSITSGLGEAKPKCLLIVPIKSDNAIEGVIELASFKVFEPYQIDFIERLSRRIATTIAAVKANEKNAKLLSASKEFANKLRIKEIELQKQIENYEIWVKQFEQKLSTVADEASMYQNIINKMYDGIILTNEKFVITKVNDYILEHYKYTREELEGQSVDVLVETEYANIIDLKSKKFHLNYKVFKQSVNGKVIDQAGDTHAVMMMSGKLEIDNRVLYVFLFNNPVNNGNFNNLDTPSDSVYSLN